MTDKNEGDMSYMERVEKIREEKQGKDKEMAKKIVIFLGSFLSLGLLIGFIAIGELGAGIIVAGIAIVVSIALANVEDEAWEEFFLEELERAKQQQEDGPSESDPKRICSSCGWQNPSNNNFCHDCGSKLS